jgi:glucose/arabinose dehydrogenase
LLKFLKRLLITILVLLVLIIIAPFILLQFGSESAATSTKLILNALVGYSIDTPTDSVVEQRLIVPDGFVVNLYAGDLAKIRFLRFTQGGDLLATRPRQGEVILLGRDADGDALPDSRKTLLTDLNRPHGLDLWNGWLYIAESDAIGRVRFNQQSGELEGDYQRIVEGLTGNGNHWSKTVRIGPDGWMYVSAGSTCNVCDEEDPLRAAISRYRPDGSDGQLYASGLRNSVGFDWSPWDQQLYATDNGRDLIGDDFPPCELNRIKEGGFYGWPNINGFGHLDPDYGEGREGLLETALSPAFGFKAHNAPLGMTFIRNAKMPAGYEKSALVALHGSWNRSERDGYKVVSLHWQDDGSIVEKDFLSGFLEGDNVIGRPVDVAEGPDGAVYVTDDYAGAIYRVAFGEPPIAQRRAAVADVTRSGNQAAMQQAYDAEEIAAYQQQGATLFQQYACGNCHEARKLRAGATLVSLDDLAARYSVGELAAFFTAPTPPMPVFPLSDEQRESMAVYLYTRE